MVNTHGYTEKVKRELTDDILQRFKNTKNKVNDLQG
jgi:hypothetical protein